MTMRQRQFNGPKLPAELLNQFGESGGSGRNGQNYRGANGRKAQRQAQRAQKKQVRRQPRPTPRRAVNSDEESDLEVPVPVVRKNQHVVPSGKPKSILKPTKTPVRDTDSEDETEPEAGDLSSLSESEVESAKEEPRPGVPNSTKRRLNEDDAEIAALEKKLGNKGKKSQHEDDDDGLDFILEGLGGSDSDSQPAKRKCNTEDDDWLASKRRKAEADRKDKSRSKTKKDISEDLSASDVSSQSGGELDLAEEESDDVIEDDDDFARFDSEASEEPAPKKERENPYVAPVQAAATPSSEKYVPPSLRGPPASEAESLTRLRRQIQGLLNRLSEANLPTILKDIENVYLSNARQYVTTTLIDLLLTLTCDRTTLNDTFLILHAGFITAVYKVVGTDFGAQLVERLVSEFDKFYAITSDTPESGKEPTNLVSLMAELYNFQVIGHNIIFDYLQDFLSKLTDLHTELILRMVKLSGHQLRQDDPSALKHIVLLLQKSVADVGEAHLSVRTKFMVETINNLKNNRMKTGLAASSINAEHTTRMKKTLGALNTRSVKATEPLRIGLADIRNTDKKGKWWLVGASWKGNDQTSITVYSTTNTEPRSSDSTTRNLPKDIASDTAALSDPAAPDIPALAAALRMNTAIRRAIFAAIMSAADYSDAHTRLLKLRLKRAQEPEIPRVLLACAGAEASYNPYYTLIARKLCAGGPGGAGAHRVRMAFSFALWDVVKRLSDAGSDGEAHEVDDDDDDALDMPRIVNLARLYGALIGGRALPVTCLKTVEFPYLAPRLASFVEVLLVSVMQACAAKRDPGAGEKELREVFGAASGAPGLSNGLQYFVGEVVRKGEIVSGRKERAVVRRGCDLVREVLAGVDAENGGEE